MRTVLLVTLVSVIGSLLAFDQFFLMTAGQPLNQTATSVFYIYLNTFPFLKLGYGAALSLMLAAIHPRLHGHPDGAEPPEPRDERAGEQRDGYLVGARACSALAAAPIPPRAICVAICTVMVLPIVASVLASVKPTAEAAETPPTYFPHGFSLDAYRRLWEYQDGLPTYVLQQPRRGRSDGAVHARAHGARRLRPGPLPDPVQGGRCSSCCCSP